MRMHRASWRILIRFTVFIFYDDNHYAMIASKYKVSIIFIQTPI